MIFNGFASQFWISLPKQLIANSDAVVSQCLSVAVVNALADLQKFEVIIDCLAIFFNVVVKHADRVVGATLIPDFPSTPASEGQHFVVLQPPHGRDISTIVDLLIEFMSLLLGSFVENRVLFGDSSWSIEEKRQLNTMGL